MDRIVDIGTEGLHLSAYRGFLIVAKDREEVGRVPLDDVHAVILHAYGCTWTGNLVAALAERGRSPDGSPTISTRFPIRTSARS